MEKVQSYVNDLMVKLDEMAVYETNRTLDPEILKDKVTAIAEKNYQTLGDPALTGEQLDLAFDQTTKTTVSMALELLLIKGRIKISGVNENGEFLYSLNQS